MSDVFANVSHNEMDTVKSASDSKRLYSVTAIFRVKVVSCCSVFFVKLYAGTFLWDLEYCASGLESAFGYITGSSFFVGRFPACAEEDKYATGKKFKFIP